MILLSVVAAGASGRSLRMRTFGINDGLPSHNLTTIKQDRNGVIWIATWNGISNFDGYHFNTYRSTDRYGTLSSNRISDIEPDSLGNIWILTYDRSLYLLDPKNGYITDISTLIREISEKQPLIKDIVATGDNVWVVGDGQHPSIMIPIANPKDPSTYKIVSPTKLPDGTSEILKIEVDNDKNDWIFTDKGILNHTTSTFHPGHFREIQSMPDGYTYILAADGTVYKYKKNSKKIIQAAKMPGISEVSEALPASKNLIVAGTDAGILVFDTNKSTAKILPVVGSSPAAAIENIYLDSKKRLWAFTSDGRVALFTSLDAPGEILPVDINGIETTPSKTHIWVEDRFGTIWLAPKNGPISSFDPATRHIVPQELRSPNLNYAGVPMVERAFVDRQNNLWLASSHNLTVVNFINENFNRTNLVSNEESRSLGLLDDGTILMGTGLGTIGHYDSRTGKLIDYYGKSPAGGIPGTLIKTPTPMRFATHIYAIHQDRNHNIWVGTKGDGLFKVAPDGSVSNFRYDKNNPYSIPCDSIYHFLEDNTGNLWIATYGGGLVLAKNDRETGAYKFISSRNDLRGYPNDNFNRIRRLASTPDGDIIASCTAGLVTFSSKFSDPAKINFYTSRHKQGDPASLATDNVMQTLVASDGSIYVLPLGEKPQRIESKDLLKNQLKFAPIPTGNNIYSLMNSLNTFGNTLGMIEDKNKNINFVCESTIVIYDPSTGNSYSLPTRRLDPNMEFTEAMPLMNPATGDIWYGQLGGALIVTPDKSIVSHHVPNIVVTSVQFRGEPERTKMLNPDIIEVPAGIRDISVFFAALDYPGSDNIQYAYKLNDADDWTYIYNANSIYLNELMPGNHKLTIRSTNSDGIWQENDRTIKIHVEPTFAESIWAKLLWGILIIGVISGLVYLYTVNRRNRMFESLHRKEHDFFIEASHRLRTPLTLIGSPVAEVLSSENLSEKGRTHLEKVHRNAYEMLDLVDKMLVKGFEKSDIVDDRTIDKEETLAIAAESAPADEETSAPGHDKEITILVVEDNTDLRHFLRDILESQYNVATASNGKIGLEMAQKIQPDFIVTDITMPEMDGLTMVHKIKQDKTLSHIPIIVLSAKSSVRDRVEGLKEGIDDYITKPFSATYLRQRIASIIAQRLILQQSYFERLGQEMKSTITPSSDLLPEQAAETPQQQAPAANESTTNGENASTQFDYRLESPSITDSDQEMMAKLLKFIESRISDESLKIEELAESVNMGRTVFYGKIKALVGMSPSDFVRKLRMQRAKELIVKSKMNFSQIAYNVGFSDPKYFTKCFKKETGMTPSEYRQKSAPAEE